MRAEPWGFIWRCWAGHESAHSEATIRALRVVPRCPIQLPDGRPCWAPLQRKLRPLRDEQPKEQP